MTPVGSAAPLRSWPGRNWLASKNRAWKFPAPKPLKADPPLAWPTNSPFKKFCCSTGGTSTADGCRVKFWVVPPAVNWM